MFRLHKGGRPPSHNAGTLRGEKSLWFDAGLALRFYSTHPATLAAIGERKFFKPLTLLGRRVSPQKPSETDPKRKRRRPPRACTGRHAFAKPSRTCSASPASTSNRSDGADVSAADVTIFRC